MVEDTKQELITLKGQLKGRTEEELKGNFPSKFWDENGKLIVKTSVNNDEFYSVPLELGEDDLEKIQSQFNSIMLIFWKKNFDKKTQEIIANLKENQNITVHGHLGGRDNGLLGVVKLETEDDGSDLFI
jgi:hypothetical protein